ncbi:MAG: 50S ribosomal protein L25 [Phycisphaerales bacterium]|nr:50S ribosomal protein L25 [Phycisphaerales bacterium]
MHEDAPILEANRRAKLGSRYAKRARAEGRIPAVVYGHKQDAVPVALDSRAAVRHFNKGERVFRIAIDGSTPAYILLKDLQFDHLGTHPVHADFMRVDLHERITVNVSVHLVGEAKGLGTAGAVMIRPYTEIEVECTLATLPEFIEVNVADMDVGSSLTAKQVALPDASMKLKTSPDAVVAHIVIVQEEKVAEAAPTDAAAAAATPAAGPAVITEEKKKERDAAKADADKPAAKGGAPKK